MMTRREFAAISLAGSVALADMRFSVGLQTWIFTSNTPPPKQPVIETAIRTMEANALHECDLHAGTLGPDPIWRVILSGSQEDRPAAQKQLAEWRAATGIEFYRECRKRFAGADIRINGVSGLPFATPEDFRHSMRIADALGAERITVGLDLERARSMAAVLAEYSGTIGFQGRPDLAIEDPRAISRPERYLEAVSLGRNFRIVLDIGDATGGGWDVLPFVREHGQKIDALHVKDRRRDKTSMRFGTGETPVAEVLRLVHQRSFPIHCYIDCDYKTDDRVADVQREVQWVRKVLQA